MSDENGDFVQEPVPEQEPEQDSVPEQEPEQEPDLEQEQEPEQDLEPEQEQEPEPDQEPEPSPSPSASPSPSPRQSTAPDPSDFLPDSVTNAIRSSITSHGQALLAQHQSQFDGLMRQLSQHQQQLELLNSYARRGQNANAFMRDGYSILSGEGN